MEMYGNVQRELESALLMGFSRLSERYDTNEQERTNWVA